MARVEKFGPPLALMGLIYFLSAQPDLSSGLGTVDLIGRKIVHATEYGVLFLLWIRVLGYRRAAAAAAICVLYACSDEFHQTFVHGRHGTPVDVLIDSTGVAIAWALVRTRRRRRRRAARPA
ncbi:MAG: VanZ family protein [Solirubrobacteraceae bacterium]